MIISVDKDGNVSILTSKHLHHKVTCFKQNLIKLSITDSLQN